MMAPVFCTVQTWSILTDTMSIAAARDWFNLNWAGMGSMGLIWIMDTHAAVYPLKRLENLSHTQRRTRPMETEMPYT